MLAGALVTVEITAASLLLAHRSVAGELVERLALSGRGRARVARVARTVAALAGGLL